MRSFPLLHDRVDWDMHMPMLQSTIALRSEKTEEEEDELEPPRLGPQRRRLLIQYICRCGQGDTPFQLSGVGEDSLDN